MSSVTTSSDSENAAAKSEADRPTNVVFFDGVCGLCNRFVDFVLSRDRRGAIRFAPLQGETAMRVVSAQWRVPTGAPPSFPTIVWLDAEGKEHVRSSAVAGVLEQLGGIWSLVGCMLWLIPRPLRDLEYGIVAANRYWFFGKRETCRLPAPAERDRFLP